jgi:pimeloyl-ACP methyl ester carboxylesterase
VPPAADAPDGPFKAHRAGVSGRDLEYLEAGAGDPLLVLGGSAGLALVELAETRRVIVPGLTSAGLAGTGGRELAAAAGGVTASLGLGPCDLLGTGAGGAAALWLAAGAPDRVRALVLESPPDPEPELAAVLPGLLAPVLLLCGTRDEPGPGVACQQLLPNAFLSYVYGAGPDIRGDRPGAFAAVAADFLARHGRFLARDGAGRPQ